MKKFNLLLSAVVLFLAGNSFVDAQNSKNPWAITVGAHAVDHNSVTGPFNQYFKTDNWDIGFSIGALPIILVGMFLYRRAGSDRKTNDEDETVYDQHPVELFW